MDELDRCRPDYALSLLETIKHFFAVDGVHFVLGVNLSELENSVKARYGQGCDATAYLQKFIVLRITLPEASPTIDEHGNALVYFEKVCVMLQVPHGIAQQARSWLRVAGKTQALTLRQMERVATRMVLVAASSRVSEFKLHILISLEILSVLSPTIVASLKRLSDPKATFRDQCQVLGLKNAQYSKPLWGNRFSDLACGMWWGLLGCNETADEEMSMSRFAPARHADRLPELLHELLTNELGNISVSP